MANRILKDIRIYESENENIAGKSLPSELGGIFKSTNNTTFIGQRIARKLNELKFSFGEFDHIYINLTNSLKENEIQISDRDLDKRIKYINFGVLPENFNSLKNKEKDEFIETKILEIFRFISNKENLELVNKTALQISEFKREIEIHFKTKETKSYRIEIYYQIAPINNLSNIKLKYFDKKNNLGFTENFELEFYSDIYYLIDNISLTNNKIVLKPKKSYRAELHNENYKTPIEFEITELKKITTANTVYN